MKVYQILGALTVILALSLGLLACGKSPQGNIDGSFVQPTNEIKNVDPFLMKVEDINTVYINAVSTSEEVKVILDHTTDIKNIKELLGILNNARPYSGAAPADRYGEFTFSMKDGSENSLEFNGHGLFFVVNASQSYILEPESDVKLLNTFIDGLKNLLHTKNQF